MTNFINWVKIACDYKDALEKGLDEIILIKGDKKYSYLSETEKETIKNIRRKIWEIDDAAGEKNTPHIALECPNFKILMENEKIFGDHIV